MAKRKRHPKSIMQIKDGRCYLCMQLYGNDRIYPMLHEHHIYPGNNRAVSEANGFKVYLCAAHHTMGAEAVHNKPEYLRMLQEECQRIYEEDHTREEFRALIGKSYLPEEEQNKAGFWLLEEGKE